MSVFSENPSLNRRIDDDSEPYSGQEDSFHQKTIWMKFLNRL